MIVKSPVEAPVAVVVPKINLSADSSQAIIALSPLDPLSITIPQSFAFEDEPVFNSNILSLTVVFVVATVVVVPLTVKLPDSVKFTPVAVPVNAGLARGAFVASWVATESEPILARVFNSFVEIVAPSKISNSASLIAAEPIVKPVEVTAVSYTHLTLPTTD